ncbi:MAG: T9SS type A sorting domain-containing protein [Flavobacteriia bacterium]|nr:T9SS type A sorting domain-containing protein [Flavobacteriia bacterium]
MKKNNTTITQFMLPKIITATFVKIFTLALFSFTFFVNTFAQSTTICVGSSTQINSPSPGGTWQSSDNGIGTIDANGVFTSVALGSCFVTYTDLNLNVSSYQYTVVNNSVGNFIGQDTICIGGSNQIMNTNIFGNWGSQNNSIVTVSGNYDSGVAVGTTNITYTIAGIGCTATANFPITVVDPIPETITLISAVGTNHQVLNVDHISGDTIYYESLDTIKYQIGGSATSAYLTGGMNSIPNGALTSFANGVFKIFGNPIYVSPPILSNPLIYNYHVSPSGGDPLLVYCVNNGQGGSGSSDDITLNPPCVNHINSNNSNVTVCEGMSVNLSFSVTGTATGVTVTGLPLGVSGSFSNSVYTISGTPIWTGQTNYSYTLNTTGGNCIQAIFSGNITIEQMPMLVLISTIGSDHQVVCTNENVQAITYSTFGNPCSISASGLPSGIYGNGFGSMSINGSTIIPGTYQYFVTAFGNSCPSTTLSGSITVNPGPTVNPISGPTAVCVGSTINLTTSTSGGVWSSSNNTKAIINPNGVVSGISAGNVTMTYTLTSGNCTSTQSYSIIVNALPIVNPISGSNNVCVGSSVTLSSSTVGGTWSSGNVPVAIVLGGGIVNGMSAGNSTIFYTVTSNGCSTIQNYAVTVNATPTIPTINGSNAICIGNNSAYSSSSLGGVWSVGNNNIAQISPNGILTGLNPGMTNIHYTVSTGNCASNSDFMIQVGAPSSITLASSLNTTNQTVCMNSAIQTINYTVLSNTSTASITSGALPNGVSGIFNNGTFSISGTPTEFGVFTYQISTFGSTCGVEQVASGTITVNEIPIAIGGNTQDICVSNQAIVSGVVASGGNISWTHNGAGYFVSGQNTVSPIYQTVSADAGNSVILTLTVTNTNGCLSSATVNYYINVAGYPNVPAIQGPDVACIGAPIVFTNTLGGGVWGVSNNATGAINMNGVFIGNSTGSSLITYTVTSGFCTYIQYHQISVNTIVTPSFLIPTNVCQGSTHNVLPQFSNNTPPIYGSWSPSYTTEEIGSNTYTFTPNSNQCANSVVKTITVDPLPVANFTFTNNGNEYQFTNTSIYESSAYNWSFGNGQISNLENPTCTYSSNNLHLVVLEVSNACGIDSYSVQIGVNGMNENNNNNVLVFPNPFNNIIQVVLNSNEESMLMLYDITGKLILCKTIFEKEITLDLVDLEAGTYQLQINQVDNNNIIKIIKY